MNKPLHKTEWHHQYFILVVLLYIFGKPVKHFKYNSKNFERYILMSDDTYFMNL